MESRIYETLGLRFFSRERLQVATVLRLLEFVDAAPLLRELATFDRLEWQPRGGGERTRKVAPVALGRLRRDLRLELIRSFELRCDREGAIGQDRLAMVLEDRPPSDDEAHWDELQIVVGEARLAASRVEDAVELFAAVLEICSPCYAVATLELEARDPSLAEAEALRRAAHQPITWRGEPHGFWDCDRMIRDVGWLNYFGEGHLEQLPASSLEVLSRLPYHRPIGGGVMVALDLDPRATSVHLAAVRQALALLMEPEVA